MPTVARKYGPEVVWLTACSLGIPGIYYLAPLLCSEKWRSVSLIPKLTKMPILFLAGDDDEVIPAVHMRELYSIVDRYPSKGLSPSFMLI